MFKVQVRWPNGSVSNFDIDKDCITLGRAPDSDVFLPSEQASRHHASIYRKGDKIVIEDMESANGTFVGPDKIKLPTEITPAEPAKLGDVYIRVKYIDKTEKPKSIVTETGSYSIAQRLGDHKQTVSIHPDMGADLRRMLKSGQLASMTAEKKKK